MRWLFAAIVLVLGAALGAGAGLYLQGDAEYPAADSHEPLPTVVHAEVRTEFDYVRLNSQFVIPVVSAGKVKALVALSLSIEVLKGSGDLVFSLEPKIRDSLLRVLFDHANTGGFDGEFTASGNLAALRRTLTEAARSVLGETVSDVLITDIARQDS